MENLSYLDDKVEKLLGHLREDFVEGGSMYGAYGTFLPKMQIDFVEGGSMYGASGTFLPRMPILSEPKPVSEEKKKFYVTDVVKRFPDDDSRSRMIIFNIIHPESAADKGIKRKAAVADVYDDSRNKRGKRMITSKRIQPVSAAVNKVIKRNASSTIDDETDDDDDGEEVTSKLRTNQGCWVRSMSTWDAFSCDQKDSYREIKIVRFSDRSEL